MLSRLKAGIDRLFPRHEVITDEDREVGFRAVIADGLASQAVATLATGPLLVAFALQVGGSNAAVGLLAAIPFLTQFFQLPAVLLVETLQRRRAISIIAATISRLALLLIAAAVLVPRGHDAITLLVVGLFLHASFGAVAGCSWNSWVQDFVPEDLLGAVFGKRLLWAAAVGAILSLSLVDVGVGRGRAFV